MRRLSRQLRVESRFKRMLMEHQKLKCESIEKHTKSNVADIIDNIEKVVKALLVSNPQYD
ncbi:hypothetical protein GCM10023310_69410 [Paenibacillus vulneris]